jgi:hypothetical protein
MNVVEARENLKKSGEKLVEYFSSHDKISQKAYVEIHNNYITLLANNQHWMNNSEYEIESNIDFLLNAKGDVLVAGLGLGFILLPLANVNNVKSITVVEKSKDVISLIGPFVKSRLGDKVNIICDDIFTWEATKPEIFDSIYFDIWMGDGASDFNILKSKFKSSGYMNYWKYIKEV